MGSEEFARRIFEKVFIEDINRLRSMEDMWKTRRPPEPLQYDKLSQEASQVDASVAKKDQTVWTLSENFVVFCDR